MPSPACGQKEQPSEMHGLEALPVSSLMEGRVVSKHGLNAAQPL